MRPLVLVLLLSGALSAGPLDGTRWAMRFWDERSWIHISRADKLSFDGDVFTSYGALTYDFAPSSYTAVSNAGGLRWRSVSRSSSGEMTYWDGVWSKSQPDRMEGDLFWRQSDGRLRQYRWKAKRRK